MEERILVTVKGLWESILREERAIDFEEHPPRPTITPRRTFSLSSALRRTCVSPACGKEKDSPLPASDLLGTLRGHPCSVGPQEWGPAPSPASLKGIPGAFSSPPSIFRLTKGVEGEVRAWWERPLCKEHYAVFPDRTFLSIRRGESAKEPVYRGIGDQARRPLGNPGPVEQKRGAPRTERKCLRTFGRRA